MRIHYIVWSILNKMGNKILIYAGGGLVVLLLLIGTFGMMGMTGGVVGVNDKQSSSSAQDSMAGHHDGGSQKVVSSGSSDLDKYRSDDIPADCRLPSYDNDVVGWAEHMGHHAETQFCLEYYADVIESQNAVDSSGVPLKCQVPSGKSRASWIEHLGHHTETKECLKYFD